MYRILETEEFRESFEKLEKRVRKVFEKKIEKVRENPYAVGKKLRIFDWFRELRYSIYRLYYLVYEKEVIVLFVGVSNKKTQQKAIDSVLEKLEEFKKDIENNLKGGGI